jgi:hypothetical protein
VAATAVESINNLTLDQQQNSPSFMQMFMLNAQIQQEERRQERFEAERQRQEERQIRKEEEKQRREERREELQMFIAAFIKK